MKHTLFAALALLSLVWAPAQAALTTTIFDIQFGLVTLGEEVTVESVVVTASGRFGFFVQEVDPRPDPIGRKYTGIWVFTYGDHLGFVKRGDLVNVTGIYDEYFDFSEIDITHDLCSGDCGWEVVGTAEEPEPVIVLLTDINDTGVYNEAYESVLVGVDLVDEELWAGAPDGYGEWQLWTDGVGVGDFLWMESYSADPDGEFDYPLPTQGDVFTFANGVLTYSYGIYKLAPRNCPEDLGIGCPPILRGLWATGSTGIDVLFAVDVDEGSAENTDAYYFDSGLVVLAADRDLDNHRVVHLTTEPMTPGLVDIGYVEGVLSEGDLVMMPDGEFTFAQGITSIEQIQTVTDLLLDDSPYLDVIVSTTGRVTAIENQYYYLQEGDAGPFKHLYVRVAKTGDMAIGDVVMTAGRVTEYYGSTYVSFASGVQFFENLGPSREPVIVTDLTVSEVFYNCDDDDDVGPQDNRAEPWEDALVRIEPAALDSVFLVTEQFGEWYLLVGADSALVNFTDDMNDFMDYPSFLPGDSVRVTGILRYDFDYKVVPRAIEDVEILASTSVDDLPYTFRALLMQNNPNPFQRSTSIVFELPGNARAVTVDIFDVTGARVQRLLDHEPMNAGPHVVSWQGVDENGLPVSSGNYFYRVIVDDQSAAKQMLMLK